MQTDIIYAKYYVIVLAAVIALKLLFIILRRIFGNTPSPSARFFFITLVFSYLGLTGGFIVSYIRQPAITITVLAGLFFVCGTMAVIFNDRYNTGFNRKIGTYTILLMSITLAIGSGTENLKRKKLDDAKNIFPPETKMEKYKAVFKKGGQAFLLFQSI
jgi:hypothetical protein